LEEQWYHHHAVDDPSSVHQSSIQNTETRYTLQGDKRSSSELPRVVTSVQPSWGWVSQVRHIADEPLRTVNAM